MIELNRIPYDEARSRIKNADLLLFRPRGALWWRAIAVAGRSEYTHAGMAGWWGDRLMNVEMTSGGGRAQLLSNLVERWPGVIDVYAANAVRRRFSRERAVQAMIGITGKPYGKWNLFRASLYHMPFVRFMVSPDTNDVASGHWPPFCSQAASVAYRLGGVDPVPNLTDRLTEPGDLARSPFFQYRFTLMPKREEGSRANVQ